VHTDCLTPPTLLETATLATRIRTSFAPGGHFRSCPGHSELSRHPGNISAHNVAVSLPKVNTVVIGQFAFQHDVVVNAVSKAGSESEVIGAGLRHIQVIKKDAGFGALLREK
jgi:hypothetical protein